MFKFIKFVKERSTWEGKQNDNSECFWPSKNTPLLWALDGRAALTIWVFWLVLITVQRDKVHGPSWIIDWRPD